MLKEYNKIPYSCPKHHNGPASQNHRAGYNGQDAHITYPEVRELGGEVLDPDDPNNLELIRPLPNFLFREK